MLRKRPFRLTAPTHSVPSPILTLLLQAGQMMHELLCSRSHLRRQPRGDSIVHRGRGGEQLVGTTQQRASLSEGAPPFLWRCGHRSGRAWASA
jgi:hypothetical protein